MYIINKHNNISEWVDVALIEHTIQIYVQNIQTIIKQKFLYQFFNIS
jgi:hypothetical protein